MVKRSFGIILPAQKDVTITAATIEVKYGHNLSIIEGLDCHIIQQRQIR